MSPRLLLALLLLPACAGAAEPFTVRTRDITDEKAVFATIESRNVVPARARIGGTIGALAVRDGDKVVPGQVIAVVGDEKLVLQLGSLEAQIAGLGAQLGQAQADFTRAETLYRQGSGPRVTMDQARTAAEIATATLKARHAERDVLRQNLAEGEVLAPVAGRVLQVPLTAGSVVLPGDSVATIAEQSFILRLRVPERHAASLKPGDPVRLDAGQLGVGAATTGRISLVYPQITEGQVTADAVVEGIGDYFVGERVLVWIAAGARPGIVIAPALLSTSAGLDYVRLRHGEGSIVLPVQRGQETPGGIEILSGLHDGDVLVTP